MTKHHLIGKLCQYKSDHRDKVLFTYKVSEEEKKEIEYSLLFWDGASGITANTLIPVWHYHKYMEYRRHNQEACPDPTTYHTPYVVRIPTPTIAWNPNNSSAKIQNFLVVDAKVFVAKIGNVIASQRTVLKALFTSEDSGEMFWVDEKWIEPYSAKETYLEDLKGKLLNKLRQNT
jgi:hypothetical protein